MLQQFCALKFRLNLLKHIPHHSPTRPCSDFLSLPCREAIPKACNICSRNAVVNPRKLWVTGGLFTIIFNPAPPVFSRWVTGAAVVNAFYSSSKNQIGRSPPMLKHCSRPDKALPVVECFRTALRSPSSVPSRDPPAAFLQQRPGQISELRRHRHGYRPRDHARLR